MLIASSINSKFACECIENKIIIFINIRKYSASYCSKQFAQSDLSNKCTHSPHSVIQSVSATYVRPYK